MIDVKVLASGSKGNAYLLTSKDARILLDCGRSYSELEKKMDFKLPDALFVTHEHGDHSKSVRDFINRGVDVWMTDGTCNALKLNPRHNLHVCCDLQMFLPKTLIVGDCTVYGFKSFHDAACPVNFAVFDEVDGKENDVVFYITDTREVPIFFFSKNVNGFDPLPPTKILIEANYDEEELHNSDIDEAQKKRIVQSHLSVNTTIQFLTEYTDLSRCKEITLIHVSRRHGDGEKFRQRVEDSVKKVAGHPIKITAAKCN